MLGILLAIVAACCWGVGAVFVRLGLQHLKPSVGTLVSMVSSLILVGLLAVITDFDTVTSLTHRTLLWFGLIGVVNYGMGRQFNYLSIKYVGVAKATPIFASAPLFSMVLAVTFIGESINLPTLIGTFCIVGGLYLVVTSK